MSGRPVEIEDPSNRWFIHQISAYALPPAIRLRLSPNMVSCGGMACGLAAGACYTQAPDFISCLAGFLLMILWHVCDGLDGQLARATGQMTALGRVLDGICDYVTFITVYLGLGWSMARMGQPHWALMLASGAAHALQSNLYEARRQAYGARLRGTPAHGNAPPPSGIGIESWYDHLQTLSLGWTRATDEALQRASDPAAARATYRLMLAPVLKLWCLLGANFRTFMIFMFSISAFGPAGYFLWELVGLTLILLALEMLLRAREHGFRQDISAQQFPARQ